MAVPFVCQSIAYRISADTLTSNSKLTAIDMVTAKEAVVKADLGYNLNPACYNSLNNLIYAIATSYSVKGKNELIVIDSTGATSSLGVIPVIPSNQLTDYNAGDIDEFGRFFIKSEYSSVFHVIDLNPESTTYTKFLDPRRNYAPVTSPYTGIPLSQAMPVADLAYNIVDHMLYGVATDGRFQRLDPKTGTVTNLTVAKDAAGNPTIPVARYGSSYSVNDEYMYTVNNDTGVMYRVTINGNLAIGEKFMQSTVSILHDGASCIKASFDIDYGDAPDTGPGNGPGNYTTLLAHNGPRHRVVPQLRLGANATGEKDAYQNSDATGDDLIKAIKDDMIVEPMQTLLTNQSEYTITARVTNITGIDATLHGWLDLNGNGVFNGNEYASAIVKNGDTSVNLTFSIPTGVTPKTTFARFRLTTDTLVNTNSGNLALEDTRSIGAARDGEVEDYRLSIEELKITGTKTVDKAYADLGDVLTYTVQLKNNSTTSAISNVKFSDDLPTGTTYIPSSLSVNASYTGTDLKTGITFSSIPPNTTINITYKVTVDTVSNPNIIKNTGQITVETIAPIDTTEATTQVNYADLLSGNKFLKTVDKALVEPGGEITYNLRITNSGNVSANNINITDSIPTGTTYVPGSTGVVDLNGASVSFTGDITSSIHLTNPLSSGATVLVTFKVTAPNTVPNPNSLQNKANISYTYTVDPAKPNDIKKSGDSNTVNTEIINITATKTVDKAYADLGAILTYTVLLKNNSTTMNVANVKFSDTLPEGIKYIDNTLVVDSPYTGDNLETGITFASVAANQTIKITYQATVNSNVVPNPNPVLNTGQVTVGKTTINTTEAITQINHADLISVNNFSKHVDKALVEPEGVITYNLTISNTGNVSANNIEIIDVLPAGTTYVPGSINSTVAITGDPTSSIHLTNPLPAGATAVVNFQVTAPNTVPSPNSLQNKANISYTYTVDPLKPDEIRKSGDSNVVNTEVIDISGLKSVDKAFADLDDTLTYTVELKNNSKTMTVANVKFSDILPEGTTYVNGTLDADTPYTGSDLETGITFESVAANQIIKITYQAKVDPNKVPAVNPLKNTGQITVGNSITNTSEAITTINHAELLSQDNFVKSVDKASVEPGGVITYTIKVANSGNVAANKINIVDSVPTGTTYVADSIGVEDLHGVEINFSGDPTSSINLTDPLPAGTTVLVTFKVTAPSTVPSPNSLQNKANISYTYTVDPSNPDDISKSGDSNTVNTELINVTAIKTVDKSYADLGDTLTYTVELTNNSKTISSPSVVFKDALPDGIKYVNGTLVVDSPYTGDNLESGITFASIAPNQTIKITYKAIVDANTIPKENAIKNTGQVKVGDLAPVDTNEAITTINHADILAEKNFTKSVDKAGVEPGGVITYTLTITNSGNAHANKIEILDTLPAGTTYVPGSINSTAVVTGDPTTSIKLTDPLPAGMTVVVNFQVLAPNTVPNPNTLENKANIVYYYTVDPSQPDSIKKSRYSNTVNTEVINVTATKTVDKAFADLGEELIYTVELKNNSKVMAASNVMLTDILPEGTTYVDGSLTATQPYSGNDLETGITFASIVPDQTITITYKAKIDSNTIPKENPIKNTGQVKVGNADPVDTNEAITTINHADILSEKNFVKSVDNELVMPGGIITYTLTIANTGNVAANNIDITDVLPTGTTYVAGSTNATVEVTGDPTTSIKLTNPLSAGSTATVNFQVVAPNTVPNPNVLQNKANISYSYTVNPSNPDGTQKSRDSNTVNTEVLNITATKTVDKAFADLGDELIYTVELKNNSTNIALSNVLFSDTLPTGITYVNNTLNADAPYTGTDLKTGITFASIAPNQTIKITYKATVDPTIPKENPIKNTGQVKVGNTDPIDTTEAITQINHADILSEGNFIKSVDKSGIEPGGIVTYTLKITNSGNVPANNIEIKDELQEGTTYVAGSTNVEDLNAAKISFTGDPTTSINLTNPLLEGKSVLVTFQIIAPNIIPNTLENKANILYNYLVDPKDPNGKLASKDSNTVKTEVVNITAIQTVDKEFADLGDTLTYTVKLRNHSLTESIPYIKFFDTLPEGVEYVDGSLYVDVEYTGTDLETGITFASIGPNQEITITYQAKIDLEKVPSENTIVNIGQISEESSAPVDIPQVTTKINRADLKSEGNFVKSVDKSKVNPGETITYTLKITNSGNAPATDIYITDAIPEGSVYVDDSTSVVDPTGNKVDFTGDPTTIIGIVNPLESKAILLVTFQVTAPNIVVNSNILQNQAYISYNYKVDPNKDEVKTDFGTSNAVNTEVIKLNNAKLDIKKTATKNISYVLDTIKYNISITNNGDVEAESVVLKDALPLGITYVSGTLKSNVDVTLDSVDKITLTKPIAKGETVLISFEVLVNEIPSPNPIKNIITADFKYLLDPINQIIVNETAKSNIETTFIARYNFSQQISDIIESVALEQAALAAIANAEGAKIQAMVARGDVSSKQLLCLNKSVADTLEQIALLEGILKQKLNALNCQINPGGC